MNDPDSWIVPKNWSRFQHYNDRRLLWIRTYLDLTSNPDYESLSWVETGILHVVWLEYARSRGQLTVKHIASMKRSGWKHAYLERLKQAGFIDILLARPPKLCASNLLAQKEVLRTSKSSGRAANAERARPEPEKDSAAALAEAHDLAAGWTGQDTDEFEQALDRIARKHHTLIGSLERAQLWDIAFG